MRRTIYSLVIASIFVAIGCGPKVSKSPIQASGDPNDRQVAQIAGDPVTPDPPKVPVAYEAPPHIFEPQSHPPRHRYGSSVAPDLNSLPKVKFRKNKCFRRQRGPRPSTSTAGSSLATGAVGSGGSSRPSKPTMAKPVIQQPSTPPTTPTGGGSQAPLDNLAGADVAGGAPPPAAQSAPMADSSVAMESAPAPQGAREMESAELVESTKDSKKIATDEDREEVIDDEPIPVPEPVDDTMGYEDWGASIYLSNDDTMSLSSAQRVIYAIDNFLPLPLQHIRPHELLNYFSFDTAAVSPGYDFSVYGELVKDTRDEGIYTLGLSVDGRPVDKISRRNAVITLVIDRSGSMRDEGRMNYLKRGLNRMLGELKTGDMLHLVLFDHDACVPVENFVVGRDDPRKLKKIIGKIKPRGNTNLHRGLALGYDIADKSYQQNYTNRVVMITDALTNTGVTDREMIAMISRYYDSRRIRLSGVGVGRNFNDSLLDRLTERGKGAYVFLGSEAEVDAVFGNRFISLIETTALDVHFRLHLPPSLRMNVFYGEESSTVKEDVQEIHYFAGTSQLFLSDLMARGGEIRPQDGVMLTIEYKDPETNEILVEEYGLALSDIMTHTTNVKKARLIMAWIDILAAMAAAPVPSHYYQRASSWIDPNGWQRCQDGSSELARLSEGIKSDPEVKKVLNLWEKHCSRYEKPRNPVKRVIVPKKDAWPSAKPSS